MTTLYMEPGAAAPPCDVCDDICFGDFDEVRHCEGAVVDGKLIRCGATEWHCENCEDAAWEIIQDRLCARCEEPRGVATCDACYQREAEIEHWCAACQEGPK